MRWAPLRYPLECHRCIVEGVQQVLHRPAFHRPPYRVELVVHAAGIKDGRAADVHATVSHADGYELTAILVVATLLQVLDGSARRPGLGMMGYVVEPVRLMADMERMGVNVRVEVH